MPLKDFLSKYNISENDFKTTGLKWEDLIKIKEDYQKFKISLPHEADYIVNILKDISNIKYLKSRIKDEDHLIEKIIRKKIEGVEITLENYKEKITDLIGVRALHLFKDEWELIHNFIVNNFETAENPIAYVRNGDNKEGENKFTEKGLSVQEHPRAYRSIHYVVKFKPAKQLHFIEIQVRTIFEEGWSEIDHIVRYPYNLNNEIISPYLILFNRLAGHADEMGTYLKHLDQKEKQHKEEVERLQNKIKGLQIDIKEKDQIQKELDNLKNNSNIGIFATGSVAGSLSENYPGRFYTQGNSVTGITVGISSPPASVIVGPSSGISGIFKL